MAEKHKRWLTNLICVVLGLLLGYLVASRDTEYIMRVVYEPAPQMCVGIDEPQWKRVDQTVLWIYGGGEPVAVEDWTTEWVGLDE